MAKITAAEVSKLRKTTGAGMMDCKKALVESDGDFDKAIEILRKKGQKVAAKRADRDSSEGAAIAKVNNDKTVGAVIVLACETDFVGKNDSFVELAHQLAEIALNYDNKEDFMNANIDGITVAEKLIEQTGVIGEKIEIPSFEKVNAPYVSSYIHAGNKIASIVGMSKKVEGVEEIAKDIAMQVAAMGATTLSYKDLDPAFVESETEARIAAIEKENIELGRLGKTLKHVPKYVSMSQITDEILEEAKEAAKAELKAEGKPEKIWDRILPGKIERFIADNTTLDTELCLLDQEFIKDSKKTVAEYLKSAGDVEVVDFKRVALG